MKHHVFNRLDLSGPLERIVRPGVAEPVPAASTRSRTGLWIKHHDVVALCIRVCRRPSNECATHLQI